MNVFREYLPHFKMCRIPHATKSPLDPGWSNNPITEIEPGYQYGILHQFSGTASIDIDDLKIARKLFDERSISLDYLLFTGVQISSGRDNRAKLIYKIPFVMPSKKIKVDEHDVIDFRCRGMQDVLPPSIHPDTGKPYEWIGDWQNIPTMPQEIFDWWIEQLQAPVAPTTAMPVINQSRVAHLLKFCDPEMSRMDWVKLGMSLHALSEDYFMMWDTWSAQSKGKYSGTQHNAHQWKSFKDHPAGITPRSLEYYARKGGWKPDLDAAIRLFSETAISDDIERHIDMTVDPEMPMEILPPILREYAEEVAESVGASIIVGVASGLAAISTAANAQSRLKIQEGFLVPPILWTMTIGSPAAKKSPASKPFMVPFRAMEMEDIPRYTKELERFAALEAAHVSAQKAYLKEAEKPEFIMNGQKVSDLPSVPAAPIPPTLLRFTINDTTSQKLIDMISNRPEGMTLYLDEGANWLLKLAGGKSGDDRSMWVVSYEGDSYSFDRVSRGSLFASNLAISVYMNVQPGILSEIMPTLQTDGLLQRFIPFIIDARDESSISNPVPGWMSKSDAWENLLRRVYTAGIKEYRLSTNAYYHYREFEQWIEDHKQVHSAVQTAPGFQSTIGKFAGLVGRVAMLFHMAIDPGTLEVPEERMLEAVKFLKQYVYWSVYALYCIAGTEGFDRWMFDWVITGSDDSFTEGEARKSAKRQLEGKGIYEQKDMIHMTLQHLCSLNVLMEVDEGPAYSTRYAVNPAIRLKYITRRRKVAQMKQKFLDESGQMVLNNTGRAIPRRISRGYQGELKN